MINNFSFPAWKNVVRELVSTKTVRHVAASPPVWLMLGNTALTLQLGGSAAIALNAGAALVTIGFSAYEAVTNKPKGLTYYALGALNAATAASILWSGQQQHAFDHILEFGQQTKDVISAAAANIFWCAGSFAGGFHEARKTQPRYIVDDARVDFGLGNITIVQFDPWAAAPQAVGLAKALMFPKADPDKKDTEPDFVARHAKSSRFFKALLSLEPKETVETKFDFINKHTTPFRFCALGYLAGAALTFRHDPYSLFGAAQLLWGTGYGTLDKQENANFPRDFRKVMRCSSATPT